ncbi:sex peptide receptor-related protein 2-like [Haliotis asinina]|uniref:sex peptide receptor-related protein 2-like n=1 Tax=Haliotis asinina TaxID=109174 RepID=UPI0035326738
MNVTMNASSLDETNLLTNLSLETKFTENRDILQTLFLPIVVCSGIIGIVLTVIVLSRKTMCTSTNCYLTSLAVADLLFLLIMSVQILLENAKNRISISEESEEILHHYLTILMNTFHVASVWVTVMLAVERYIAICHPLRAMAICTIKRARIVIISLFIIAFLIRIPKFFDLQFFFSKEAGIWSLGYQTMYNQAWYSLIVDGFFAAILPFTALLVLNVRLIVEIRRSSRYLRYHLAADSSIQSVISSEQLKITLMLISIIVAFFLCQSPFVVYNAINAFIKFRLSASPPSFEWYQSVTKILVALKSSCNFVLYCWFSEKFWNTFKRIFCLQYCLPKQMPKGAHANSHNNMHRPSYMVTRETTC